MQNTYKLVGVLWDNMPISNDGLDIRYTENTNNMVPISELMNNPHLDDIINSDMEIIAFLDFFPKKEYKTIWNFYIKRMLQVVKYYDIKKIYCNNLSKINIINVYLKKHKKSIE